jgi:putative acetyltransferase
MQQKERPLPAVPADPAAASPPASDDDLERQVSAVRDASRRMVRQLGFLAPRRSPTALTPSQCHLLLELEAAGSLATGELAERLQLDKSSISRAVAPLLDRKLVAVAADSRDARRKPLRLTGAGRRAVAGIHRRASAQVGAALGLLSPSERRTVIAGLDLYARALARAGALDRIELRPIRRQDDPAVERIIRQTMTSFGACGAGFAIEDPEVAAMSVAYAAPRHAYFVAARDRVVLGGAGVAPLAGGDPEVCELRKMYLLPEARGLGLGQRLLDASLAAARQLGFRRCYLETLENMTQAQRLYARNGFERLCAPLGDTGHFGCDRWYAREL